MFFEMPWLPGPLLLLLLLLLLFMVCLILTGGDISKSSIAKVSTFFCHAGVAGSAMGIRGFGAGAVWGTDGGRGRVEKGGVGWRRVEGWGEG